MDINSMLDLEKRTGVSDKDLLEFEKKADEVSRLISGLADGTIDPSQVKVPGEKTEDEIKKENEEKQKRIKAAEEKRAKEKQKEIETWWNRAELLKGYSRNVAFADNMKLLKAIVIDESKDNLNSNQLCDEEEVKEIKDDDGNILFPRPKRTDVDRLDYSVWDKWIPDDPVSLQQMKEIKDKKDAEENRLFEEANPEFCKNFKDDMEKREKNQSSKQKKMEKLKDKGNKYFKRKMFNDALSQYKKALEIIPWNCAVLTNIAQVHLKQENHEDALEYSERAIFLEPSNTKALWRRARIMIIQGRYKEAVHDLKWAVKCDPENEDLMKQLNRALEDYEDELILTKVNKIVKENSSIPKLGQKEGEGKKQTTAKEAKRSVENMLMKPPQSIEILNEAMSKLVSMQHGLSSLKESETSQLALTLVTLPGMLNECGKEGQTLIRTLGILSLICAWVKDLYTGENEFIPPYDNFTSDILKVLITLADNRRNAIELERKPVQLLNFLMKILLENDKLPRQEAKMILTVIEKSFGHDEVCDDIFLNADNTAISWLNYCLENLTRYPTELGHIILQLTNREKVRIKIGENCPPKQLCESLLIASTTNQGVEAEHAVASLANLCQNEKFQNFVRQTKTSFTKTMINLVLTNQNKVATTLLRSYGLAALLNASLGKEHTSEFISDIMSSGIVENMFAEIQTYISTPVGSGCSLESTNGDYITRAACFISRSLNNVDILERSWENSAHIKTLVLSLEFFESSNQKKILTHLVRISALFLRKNNFHDNKLIHERLVPTLITILGKLSMQYRETKGKTDNDTMTMSANTLQCFIPLSSVGEISNSPPFRTAVIPSVIEMFRFGQDGPVRKNSAIVLAKLAKASPENISIIRDLRGMEMLIEAGRKYC